MRSNNFGAFLAGALVGGVVALLFAPRSGAETRDKIRGFAEDELDLVRGRARAARAYVEDVIVKYKAKARRVVDEAEELAEDVKTFVDAERKKVAHNLHSAAVAHPAVRSTTTHATAAKPAAVRAAKPATKPAAVRTAVGKARPGRPATRKAATLATLAAQAVPHTPQPTAKTAQS
jgi:gas vesicle protein